MKAIGYIAALNYKSKIALQTDGKILVHTIKSSNDYIPALVRLLDSGGLDTSFATTGRKEYLVAGTNGDVGRVRVSTDGSIAFSG